MDAYLLEGIDVPKTNLTHPYLKTYMNISEVIIKSTLQTGRQIEQLVSPVSD